MKIIVTVRKKWAGHDEYGVAIDTAQMARLGRLGEMRHCPDLKSSDELAAAMAELRPEVMLTFWASPKVTMAIRKANAQFKYLCNVAGGVRGVVDRDVLADGLLCTNWGNEIAPSVAEGALMMILAALRRTTSIQFRVHQRGEWPAAEDARPEGLFGQKVGLHGLGVIAQELVRLIAPFRCEVSAYSPHCPDSVFRRLGVRRVDSLEELYGTNRIVSVHASKTDENFHVVNVKVLACMPDGGVLVNTARGAVIDTDALVTELKRGRIHAALDVFEEEPLPADHPLRGIENCQLMPHHAGPTPDQRRHFGAFAVGQVERYARGEPVTNIVTAEKFDLMT